MFKCATKNILKKWYFVLILHARHIAYVKSFYFPRSPWMGINLLILQMRKMRVRGSDSDSRSHNQKVPTPAPPQVCLPLSKACALCHRPRHLLSHASPCLGALSFLKEVVPFPKLWDLTRSLQCFLKNHTKSVAVFKATNISKSVR